MARAIISGAGAAGLAAGAMWPGRRRRRGGGALGPGRASSALTPCRAAAQHAGLDSPTGLCATRRRYGEFPSRDSWIQYLEDYAAHHRLALRFGAEVERIARDDGAWRVHTSGGPLEARAVVVATGYDREPHMPTGRDGSASAAS